AEMATLIPFASTISNLEDTRRNLESTDAAKTAALLDALAKSVTDLQKSLEAASTPKPKRTIANRAARTIAQLRTTLKNWYNFHAGYDPMFSWWNQLPSLSR
ncbi:MAG: DUF885 domain-containing protein, partial [Pyrinomonadaceae bacterium]